MSGLTYLDDAGVHVDVTEAYPLPVKLPVDAAPGRLVQAFITLPAAANTVRQVEIPSWATGVIMEAVTNNCRWAISEDPDTDANATVAAGTTLVALASLKVGGFLKAGSPMARNIGTGTGRTLRLISATASTVVRVEFFATA